MPRFTICIAVAFFLWASIAGNVRAVELAGIELPKEINGWKASTPVQIYDRDTLFDYIDGGAELYRAYGFTRLWVVEYRKARSPDIVVNLFHMGTQDGAYGVFTAEREGPDAGVCEESEYQAGHMRFVKGSYFGSLSAYPETPQTKEAIFGLARAVCSSIRERGRLPGLLDLLPEEGLRPLSVRYLWNHKLLNRFHYTSRENLLGLGPNTRAILARYGPKVKETTVLVVKYSDPKQASKALQRWLSQQRGGRKPLYIKKGPFLILALEIQDKALAQKILRVIRRKEAPCVRKAFLLAGPCK